MAEDNEGNQGIYYSDVIKRTLYSLIVVARPKSSKDYAWSIIKRLLAELKTDYDFLKYIHIDEIENLEDTMDDITVMSGLNDIEPKRIGQAIQNIIDIFKSRMGNKAGYFFLTEFKETLGNEYYSIIKEMGVDLRLIELQSTIYGWDSRKHKIKDKFDSNIAYIEKKDED